MCFRESSVSGYKCPTEVATFKFKYYQANIIGNNKHFVNGFCYLLPCCFSRTEFHSILNLLVKFKRGFEFQRKNRKTIGVDKIFALKYLLRQTRNFSIMENANASLT